MFHADDDAPQTAPLAAPAHEPSSTDLRASVRERWLAIAAVTAVGVALLWPASIGVMPLTGDHPVHFGRAMEFGQALSRGTPFSWNPRLGIGVPIGDGYPPLADLLVVTLRALSLGLLPWSSAYALAFTLAFLGQGWAMLRLGRALSMRPAFAATAAVVLLLSPGYPREGGWAYGVMLGVWPQLAATSATWWGLAELITSASTPLAAHKTRHALLAGVAFALGILAHPITLPILGLALPCVVLLAPAPTDTSSSAAAAGSRRLRQLGREWLWQDHGPRLASALLALATALALAAWWLLPMLDQRAWMASYGWLHVPARELATLAWRGHFTHAMASVVGWTAAAGLAVALAPREHAVRTVAVTSLLAWLLASRDAFELFRLDLVASGFGNLQYQRFVIFAEPGFLALAAMVVQRLWSLDLRGVARPYTRGEARTHTKRSAAEELASVSVMRRWTPRVLALAVAALGLGATIVRAREAGVGGTSQQRIPDARDVDDDLAELDAWLADRANREPTVRIAFVDGRNLHWFVDAAARLGVRIYKAGFLPGDNFVHKPESARPEVLDAARAEYVVTRREGPWGTPLKRFGQLLVYARDPIVALQAVHLEGPGEIRDLVEDPLSGELTFTLHGTDETSRAVLHVPGHPRWLLLRDDASTPLDWVEVPMLTPLGDRSEGLSPARRRAGDGRDGSARGPDGSEPTFIAVDAPGDGQFSLVYARWRARDVVALAASVVALFIVVLLLRRPRALPQVRVPRWALLILAAAALGLLAVRVRGRAAGEPGAVTSRVGAMGVEAGPGAIKVDMRIRWAWVLRDRSPRHELLVPLEPGETSLRGWVALDDDAAMGAPRGRRTLFVEPLLPSGEVDARRIVSLPHRPGRRSVSLDLRAADGTMPSAVRIVVESTGKAPPPIGLALEVARE